MHLKRIARGVYETADGSYRIVRSEGIYEGPRGGERDGWEICTPDPYAVWVIDDLGLSPTLRDARKRLAQRIARERG